MKRVYEVFGYLILILSAYPIGFFITRLIIFILYPEPSGVDIIR